MSFDIQGKTAIVNGANRGIGKAIVESFVQHGVAKVYAAVRNLDSAGPLVAAHGDKIVPIEIDLQKPDTITAAARTATDVQVVVNNAGVLRTESPLSNDAIESLRYELEVNVFGLIRMAQAFAPVLKANGSGVLVQLNSVVSMKCFPDLATYCASKAAAYSLTQALRDKLSDQGTAVLSVHPGPIATDMVIEAGLGDMPSDPPAVVGESIVAALKSGDFHVFPDTMAKQIGDAYQTFADAVIEAS